ncbi:MAG: class I SAM-dependent methyltransferase [Gammaproteobacteria bacterium]
MDPDKLQAFMGQIIADLGGAFTVGLVRIGHALGLYRALQDGGPMTSSELARATGLAERYVREWCAQQAASNYLAYDPSHERFTLPPEQAMVFANPDSPVYMQGAFDAAAAFLEVQPKVQAAFTTGGGVGWGEQSPCLFCATASFFRPNYVANLVAHWLPALDGVVEKLQRGAKVADVGCGHGHSTLLMAEAFPASEFVGFDFHAPSIEAANVHAREHRGLTNVRFAVGTGKAFDGDDYDLVTCFDCLHDMGDPAGVARHVRASLKPDGAWMVVEPFAHDALEENLNPVGRMFYASSTLVCVPTSLAQEGGAALGAQAGERRLREVIVTQGGFRTLERRVETPFNFVFEAHG